MGFVATIVVLITFIANLSLALVAYFNKPKSWTNRLLAGLGIIFSLWTVFNYLALMPGTEETRLFFVRVVMMVTSPMGVATFLLASIFPNDKLSVKKVVLWGSVGLASLTAALSLTPLVFARLENLPNGSFNLIPGPGIILFAINHMGLTTVGLVILFKKYLASKGVQRLQIWLFLIGNILTLTLITLSNFVAVVFLGAMQYTFIGPTFTLFQVGFITYAIVTNRFLDVRLVVTRAVAYSLVVLFLAAFYSGLLFFVSSFFTTEQIFTTQTYSILVILTLIAAFTLQPIIRIFERVTNKIFYKNRYDTHLLLSKIGHYLASTYVLSDLARLILEELLSQIHIKQGSIFLLREGKVLAVKTVGLAQKSEYSELELASLVDFANRQPERMLIFDELSDAAKKEMLRKYGINVLIPLIVENEIIGALTLGEKSSGNVYSYEDISILKILTPEVAVGVKNALSYEEIKAFNVTLQEEINKATQDLKNANEKLKELDKLKDEFVSLASHELRTPMTAIKGSISTILDGYAGDITKESREFLMAAYSENDRLIRLVNNLLNISRIESGRMTFTVTNFDLKKVIAEVVGNLQMSATDKHLNLKFDADMDLPQVSADEDKVREVLINLIGNAIKFTHEGGVTVKVGIKDGFIEVAVEDTGHGIAPEDKELLFKKFSQVNSYTKQAGGTGLGLYICKQIIESLKGRVWFDSTVGRGSTFYFTLPISAV